MFNAILCAVAIVVTTVTWNDPQSQFICGTSVMTAAWCFGDFLKGLTLA